MTTISQLIDERRKTLSESWQSFLKDPLPISIAEVIQRAKAKLPPDYLPWAPAVVIASDYLLRTAGHTSTSGRPTGWRLQRSSGDYKKGWWSFVRKRGQYWTVEGDSLYKCVLVLSFGSMPVCTRTSEAAMRLAEYFGDDSRTLGHGLRWLGPTPDGILDC
jgi:hypothetical protein